MAFTRLNVMLSPTVRLASSAVTRPTTVPTVTVFGTSMVWSSRSSSTPASTTDTTSGASVTITSGSGVTLAVRSANTKVSKFAAVIVLTPSDSV